MCVCVADQVIERVDDNNSECHRAAVICDLSTYRREENLCGKKLAAKTRSRMPPRVDASGRGRSSLAVWISVSQRTPHMR